MSSQISLSRGATLALIALLVAEVATVLYPVSVLGPLFHFPDILREPASVALPLFQAHASEIIGAYYVFVESSLLYLPIAMLLPMALGPRSNAWLRASTGLGIAAGVFQAIGFSRWIFVVPILAAQPLTDNLALLYEFANRYLGMTVGEHLGFVAMGWWTLALSIGMWGSGLARRGLTVLGALTGVLLMASTAEHFGGPDAALYGTLNFVANVLWVLWVLGLAALIAYPLLTRSMPTASKLTHVKA